MFEMSEFSVFGAAASAASAAAAFGMASGASAFGMASAAAPAAPAAPAAGGERLNVGIERRNDESAVFFAVGFEFDFDAADGFEQAAFDDDAQAVDFAAFVDFGGKFIEGESPFGTAVREPGDEYPDA